MRLPLTPEFEAEARAFGLRQHCEDCALYDAALPSRQRCAHGYPSEEHERGAQVAEIVFCKDFESA